VNPLRALLTLALALMVLAAMSLALVGTRSGSAWVVGTLSELAGERLEVTGVRGTLLQGLGVDRLRLVAGRTTVLIEPAELAVSWPDLLRLRLRLTTARAGAVLIDVGPAPPDAPDTPVEPLKLPFVIVADPLEVGRLLIRTAGEAGSAATEVEIGPLLLAGKLVDGEIRFETLRADGFGLQVSGSGRLGTGEPFPLEAEVDWRLAEPGVTGNGTLAGDLTALRFAQVVRLPAPVGVGGVARLLADEPEVIAEARWRDFRLPGGIDPDLLVTSETGRLRLRGWTDGYRAETDARLRIGARPPLRLRAAGTGDLDALSVAGLRVEGFGGRVEGNGQVRWREAVTATLRLRGTGLDPGTFDPRFPGRVDFRGEVQVAGSGDFSLALAEATGTLLDRPLRAAGTLRRQGEQLEVAGLRVAAGPNRLEVDGSWGPRVAGRFRVSAPELATLWPGASGELQGSGRFGGSAARPTLAVDLTGRNLATGDLGIRALALDGSVGARRQLDVNLGAEGVAWAGRALGDLTVALAGPPERYRVEARLAGGDVGVAVTAAGTYRDGVLAGTLESGALTLPGDGEWQLQEPATLRVAANGSAVSAHCWVATGEGEVCIADSRYGPAAFSAGIEVRGLPLAAFNYWLPPDAALAGAATGSLVASGDPRRWAESLQGTVSASLAGATVTWRVPEDEDLRTGLSRFAVEAKLTDGVLDFAGDLAGEFGLKLAASGRVTGVLGADPQVRAEITGGVPDLAALGPLLERFVDVGDVAGRVTIDATLSGDARRPDIAGGLELDEGALTVPVAGIRVDRIYLGLTGLPDGQVGVAGNARSGKGFVAIDGALAWRDQLLPTAEATVKGRVFDVIRLPEGFVQVSPDVRVRLADGQFRVSGAMLVPRAEIRLKKLEESPVRPSPDTIVHGRTVEDEVKSPPLFVLDGLAVRLGERVSFEGFGLKTGLTGGLRLSQSLAADPTQVTGDGVVSLEDGQFTAFGQKLSIERGSLIFSGVVTDPGLDVKASRDVTYEGREVTVGVLLSGTLSRIQTRVFSEPAMGELDALSYLTTGKPLSAAGAGDRSLVASSAISLGLSQALPVVQQLGSALSVDEVSFGTSESGDTAVVVGEQLGKNLFIRYSYGIFDKLGTVEATYKLGRRVSIEASSGQEQALDLIYSVTW